MLYRLARAIERLADWDRYVLTPAVLRFLCIRHVWKDNLYSFSIYQTQSCRFCGECRRVSETPIPAEYRGLFSIRSDDRLTRA